MARIAYEDDFKDKIIGASKKIIGVGALAFALAGCQTTMDYQPPLDETNKAEFQLNKEDKMSIAASKVPKVDSSNYQEILENKLSGVYQHPVYKDQIVTYQFPDDPESADKIKSQLAELGLSPSAFDDENRLYRLVTVEDATTSRHVQNLFGDDDDDINLCKIFTKNIEIDALNEEYQEYLEKEGMGEDYTEEELAELKKKELYEGYNLLMHEAAHSLKHQQMKPIDFINPSVYIMLENSSEAFATVKTIQLMNELGEDSEYINNYLQERVTSSNSVTENLLDLRANDPHQQVPTSNLLKHLGEKNMEYLLNLSDEQLDKFSEVVAKEAANYNFSELYKDTVTKKIEPKLQKFYEDASSRYSEDDLVRLKDSFEVKMDKEKNKSKIKYEGAKQMLTIVDVAIDNFEYVQGRLTENLSEYALEKIKDDIPSNIEINDPLVTVIENYDKFYTKVDKELKSQGLPTIKNNERIALSNDQDKMNILDEIKNETKIKEDNDSPELSTKQKNKLTL